MKPPLTAKVVELLPSPRVHRRQQPRSKFPWEAQQTKSRALQIRSLDVKSGIGSVTGSDKMKIEGEAQKIKGKAEVAVGNAKTAIKKTADDVADAVKSKL